MNTENKNWKLLRLEFNKELNDVLLQQHHAAQFIALAGRYMIPQQADDSNTNMHYDFDRKMLVGNELPDGLRISLHVTDLMICVLNDRFDCVRKISLEGKTKNQVFMELNDALKESGIDVSGFMNELHYEIPDHPLDNGAVFSENNPQYAQENAYYRHNAEIVMNEIVKADELAGQVKVWPHHFDTGTFIPVSHNEKGGVIQSIGIGWATPDGMVKEPYYYLSFWSENSDKSLEEMPTLAAGKWMIPNWSGAVLSHSEILKEKSPEKQRQVVESFFKTGINILSEYFKR